MECSGVVVSNCFLHVSTVHLNCWSVELRQSPHKYKSSVNFHLYNGLEELLVNISGCSSGKLIRCLFFHHTINTEHINTNSHIFSQNLRILTRMKMKKTTSTRLPTLFQWGIEDRHSRIFHFYFQVVNEKTFMYLTPHRNFSISQFSTFITEI